MRRFTASIVMMGYELKKIGCMFPNDKVVICSPESKEITVYSNIDEFKLDVSRTNVDAALRVTFIDEPT